jgi:hypothetical protein
VDAEVRFQPAAEGGRVPPATRNLDAARRAGVPGAGTRGVGGSRARRVASALCGSGSAFADLQITEP